MKKLSRVLWCCVALVFVLGLSSCRVSRRTSHSCNSCVARAAFALDQHLMPVPGKPITILIHGTRVIPPLMLACPIIIPQATTPSGLHRASDLGNVYLTRRLAGELITHDSTSFPLENLYLFGWSGALSFRSREKAGTKLYQVLREIKNNKELDNTPITVITQSHGGNVALNVAAAAKANNDSRVLIDRLIITCCPVQDATHEYVSAPIFKHVWSLFSAGDTIQTIDPQGLYPECEGHCKPASLFSQRVFKQISKLSQIEILKHGKAPGHIDFSTKYFYRRLPKILNILEDAEKLKIMPKNAEGLVSIELADL